MNKMKKAFTLIELLVVIGILAILIGILLASIGGGTESARAAKCLTNMKNLAAACNNRAMNSGWYPPAGSFEVRKLNQNSRNGIEFRFDERPGWISWNSRGAYPETAKPSSHVANGGWFTSAYNQDVEVRQYALTNGVLWKYISGNESVYLCPQHKKLLGQEKPLWSYVMNSKFGWDTSIGSHATLAGIEYGKLGNADRFLMFAELQFLHNDKVSVNIGQGSGIENDCTLQYEKNEVIGFNHPSGKRGLCAHVAFADGHVEKLLIPASIGSNGWTVDMATGDLKKLTELLCEGKDVSFNGTRYEELK